MLRRALLSCAAGAVLTVKNQTITKPPQLIPLEVTVLDANFTPLFMPCVDDPEDYLRYFRRSHLYIVGVEHSRKKSIEDVSQTIRAVRPDAVIAELCEQRKSILTKEYSEFRAAHFESVLVGEKCSFVFGDRPHSITKRRQYRTLRLSDFMGEGVGYLLLLSTMDVRKRLEAAGFDEPWKLYDNDLQQKEFEKALDDVYQRAMKRWRQVVLDERDVYLTYSCHFVLSQEAARKYKENGQDSDNTEPVRIVAVVGKAHVPGIRANWTRHIRDEEFRDLLTVPKPTLENRMIESVFAVNTIGWLADRRWKRDLTRIKEAV
ncbi:Protein F38A5.2 b [Aphelenchoides avenae]|nr:Protein F38A5.2 b [Aphelenchus avenae]